MRRARRPTCRSSLPRAGTPGPITCRCSGSPATDGLFRVIYPDVPDNWRTRLDMQWPIYTGGRAQALEKAADAERQASGKDLTAARSDLTLETTRAFWALVTATESVRVVSESVTRVEGQLHDVKARFDAGFLPPNDVLTVETRVAREHSLLIDAENQRDGARATLARLIGAPIDATFDPDATLDVPAGEPASTTTQALAEQAKSGRADRQALLFRTQAADERIDAARAGSRPQVAVAAGYDYARPNPNIFPAAGRVEAVVAAWLQRRLDAVQRRTHLGRSGRGAQPLDRGPRAARRARHADRARSAAASARSRVGHRRGEAGGGCRHQRDRGASCRAGAIRSRCGDELGSARRSAGSARSRARAHARIGQRETRRSAPGPRSGTVGREARQA